MEEEQEKRKRFLMREFGMPHLAEDWVNEMADEGYALREVRYSGKDFNHSCILVVLELGEQYR